jgi:hypothetical protein
MNAHALSIPAGRRYPLDVNVAPALEGRDRMTTAFRFFLAFPHLLLVGGPIAAILTLSWSFEAALGMEATAGGGALGAAAAVGALVGWFAIVFGGVHPDGLRKLATFYLRWRVRAVAYTALLRDEYPPFGDDAYPVKLEVSPAEGARDRLSVAFRPILALPHVLAVWALGIAWAVTTIIAWFAILFTGRYPETLYEFGVGVLRWNTRVEAYILLLHDDYPPFSLH